MLARFALTLRRLGVSQADDLLVLGMARLPIGVVLGIGQVGGDPHDVPRVRAPWSVALAANIKLFPARMAVWWVGRRDWRGLRRFVIAMVVLLVIQFVLAPQACLDYVTAISFKQVGEVATSRPGRSRPCCGRAWPRAAPCVVLALARTRYGWAAAVAFTVLANPRLLVYQFMTFLATIADADHARGDSEGPALSEATP